MNLTSKKSSLNGTAIVPGSKSHTIRAVMLGMLADGMSEILNPLHSPDGLASIYAARAFGAKVDIDTTNNKWIVHGLNNKLAPPENIIDSMNSGTTACFAIGLSSLINGYAIISGDEQIRRRPVKSQTRALEELGVTCIHTRPDNDCPPVVIGGPMKGGTCHLSGFASQHVSSILLSAPLIDSNSHVEILVEKPLETPYLQMTIDWLKHYGAELEFTSDYKRFYIKGGQKYKAKNSTISSDWSGVAFPLVAAVCTQSNITIPNLDFNDSQGDKAVVDILIEMGADITKDPQKGELHIKGGKPLHGITIDMTSIPDSLPALSVVATYASGDTNFINLAHVRVKESDRVAVMHELLTACGANIDISHDSMTVHGGNKLQGTIVDSHGDHRIAMAMTVCGFICEGEMEINNAECAYISFPYFYDTLKNIGANIETR